MLVTGMRRGEAIGLRWEDVDFDGSAACHVEQQITEVRGKSVVGTPKTKRGTRLVPLDKETVAIAATASRPLRIAERVAWGAAWNEAGLVFTREDGTALRPEFATRHFQALDRRVAACPLSACTTCDTPTPALLWTPASTSRSSPSASDTPRSAVTADLYTHVNRGVGRQAADADRGRPAGAQRITS